MSDNATKDYIKAMSYMCARFKEQAENMLSQYYAQLSDVEHLEQIGRERNVPRFYNDGSSAVYRVRVISAWEENVGRGGTADIQRVINSYGFEFKSHVSGFVAGDPYNSYNLLVRSLGTQLYDATYQYDATILYDAVPSNGIHIEIKRPIADPVPTATKLAMYEDLLKVVRASITQIAFIDVEM